MQETILITGAAATGKSTLSRALAELENFAVFEYGDFLFRCASVNHPELTHSDTRSHPELFISPMDISETDEALQQFIVSHRSTHHVVIDSHAVSKENYGFRIEPFGPGQLLRAAFSRIVFLLCDPIVIIDRTKARPEGRPPLNAKEAELYQNLQCSVAINYSTILGIPIHFLDSANESKVILTQFLNLIGSKSH
jgi:adenylate kinase